MKPTKILIQFLFLLFVTLLTTIVYAQEGVQIELPTDDHTSGFSVTGTDADRQMKFFADGGFYLSGEYPGGIIPISGAGNRLMWYPSKSAFRAGRVTGTEWDDTNIGYYSTACGYNTKASAWHATAFGHTATASGDYSTAFGLHTTASGESSTAIGSYVSTNGQTGSVIFGDYSTSTITNCDASNQMMMRFTGGYKLLGGNTLQNSGLIESTTGGFKFPDGTTQSTAATTVTTYWAGSGNDIYNSNSGNVGINTTAPQVLLHIFSNNYAGAKLRLECSGRKRIEYYKNGSQQFAQKIDGDYFISDADESHFCFLMQNFNGWIFGSDRRLKENIVPLNSTLDNVIKLKPVRYQNKKSKTKEIGFIAQDVQLLFPEMVGGEETDSTYLGVVYGRFSPIIIQALKELKSEKDKEITELEVINAKLETRVAKLEELVLDMMNQKTEGVIK